MNENNRKKELRSIEKILSRAYGRGFLTEQELMKLKKETKLLKSLVDNI